MNTPDIVCAVCDTALNKYLGLDGMGYAHPITDPADHEPVPVEAGPQWRGRCDFCAMPKAEFVLPANDFVVPHHRDQMSLGDWAACDLCALLISANRWNSLRKRAAAAFRRRNGHVFTDEQHSDLRALYHRLRQNITGPLRPIGDRS